MWSPGSSIASLQFVPPPSTAARAAAAATVGRSGPWEHMDESLLSVMRGRDLHRSFARYTDDGDDDDNDDGCDGDSGGAFCGGGDDDGAPVRGAAGRRMRTVGTQMAHAPHGSPVGTAARGRQAERDEEGEEEEEEETRQGQRQGSGRAGGWGDGWVPTQAAAMLLRYVSHALQPPACT